ncbi:MAG: hypothetical protein KTR31_17365 [Myxococcales bacterium]|nr:hypothetical protein [Myxococcales bacterium]
MSLLAVPVALAGLALLALALLVAHKSPLPPMRRPGLFWWPALMLMAAALFLLLAPPTVRYTQCEATCDLAVQGEVSEEYTVDVKADYESCAKSSVAEMRRNGMKRLSDGEALDVDAMVAGGTPGAEEVCLDIALSRCVSTCYRPDLPSE